MKLVAYDSYTRKKQPLLIDGAQELKLYVCGPTVYQHIHIGNARPYVMFMCFVRYLRSIGIDVRYVSNITDVNDKIYAAAREQGITSTELASRAAQWYREDTDRFGLGRPDVEPLASESMDGIISMIGDLVERDFAYEKGGDVYYRVEKYRDYGRLSNQQAEQMLEGSRDDLEDSGKDQPLDFALWKAAKDTEDTSWESPWGRGRPGWHIECSAMSEQELGESFDVHGGGLDLIFPHHENEIAQSRGAGRPFARLWMHVGMLVIGGEKMAKSVGNIMSLKDVLDRWPAWAVILYFFSASYRNPLEFSEQALDDSVKQGMRITESLRRSERYLASVETRQAGDPSHADSQRNWEGIHEALRDDFNTTIAMSEVFGLVYDLNTAVNEHATPQIVRNLRLTLMEFLDLFALEGINPPPVDVSEEATELLARREEARRKKQFEEADSIRDQLLEMGYVVRDTSEGVDVVEASDIAAVGATTDEDA